MHINSINIKNFKSYLDENVLDLNPGINVFVGRNGHGKSNFFQAISFVLSEKYALVKPEDKIPILYSDLRDETTSDIAVQLNFDNKARRIPIESNEVLLKRTWTHDNRDEYKLNTKLLIKNEINNIMDSCGLSRSNPYNIVHQGKINKMTNMTEEEIYELLQEITGIKQYEIKKEESLKYLAETAKEKEKIKEILDEIHLKIENISNEKDTYENYEKKENKTKCLQFCVYQCHTKDLEEKIEKIANDIKRRTEELDAMRNDKDHFEGELSTIKNQDKAVKGNAKFLLDKRQAIALEISEYETRKNFLEKEGTRENQKEKGSDKTFKKKIEGINKEMNALNTKKMGLISEIKSIEGELVETQAKVILAKTRFKNPKEKTDFLNLEIEHLDSSLEENTQSIKELSATIDKMESQIETLNKNLENKEKTLTTEENSLKNIKNNISSIKIEKLGLANKMRENIEKITELSFELEENARILRTLKESIDRKSKDSFFSNYLKLKDIITERNIAGFYGLFIDLIAFDPKLRVGVENIGKSKLFSLIVEDFETAEKIIEINKEIKGGFLTIYPLSWVKELQEKQRNYPKTNDVIILKQKIMAKPEFSEKKSEILALIDHVFSKGLFVKNYDTALKMAKEFNLNSVTAKGEVVYAEGYLTRLGFTSESSEKLSFYSNFHEKEVESIKKAEELAAEREKTKDLHNEEIKMLRQSQDSLVKETQTANKVRDLKGEIEEIRRNLTDMTENMENSQKLIGNLENEAEQIKKKKEIFEEEKKVKVTNEASSVDFMQKNGDLLKLQTHYNEVKESLIVLEEKLRELRNSKEGVRIEASELEETQIDTKTASMEMSSLENIVKELEKTLSKIEQKEGENAKLEKDIEGRERDIKEELEGLQKKMGELEKGIQEKKHLRNNLLLQKEDYANKKGNLEAIQADMITEFQDMTLEEVIDEIEKLRSLDKKKYTAKDRIMFEKLKDLQEKHQYFYGKMEELADNEQATRDLIEKLDGKSEGTVKEVFDIFKKHFVYYFKQLVPGGDASVKLIKISKENKGKLAYSTGIDIKVHFVKEKDENKENRQDGFQKISKLSSGQRTVIALALIFALQTCDPAPFYVFDEIDAALDSHYRRNIANIIQENSKSAQYLISTFKPEMTYIQDSNIYEVKFINKASHIDRMTAQKAREVLKSNEVYDDKQENQGE